MKTKFGMSLKNLKNMENGKTWKTEKMSKNEKNASFIKITKILILKSWKLFHGKKFSVTYYPTSEEVFWLLVLEILN